jgi:hypothetical protein
MVDDVGDAGDAEVTIRWPAGELPEQTITLQAGHRFEVTQGQDPVVLP